MKALVIALLLAAALPARAAFPEKPMRLIVPGPPGSPPDVLGRLVAERFALTLGQPVLVDNRPGASGTLGLAMVAGAAPDGYTLGMIAMPYVVAPSVLSRVPYDTQRDLAGVAQLVWSSNMLVVRADSPWRKLEDLLNAAQSRPGRITAASGGNATPAHLALELFKRHAAVDIQHVPFKGTVPGIAAVMGGQVDLMFATTGVVAPQLASGKLRGLALVAPKRVPGHESIPTMTELGYTGFDYRDWAGIVVPARTPAGVVERLAQATTNAVSALTERLVASHYEPTPHSNPQAFNALIRSELARWAKVVREADIRAD